MKKIAAVLLVIILMTTFLTACGKKDATTNLTSEVNSTPTYEDYELYNNVKIGHYVEVKDYLGVEVDTTSDEFAKLYKEVLDFDIEENGFYAEIKEGKVADGDIVNLDFEGKVNGVAFDGGTAQGYDLKIGSKTFIDDFEEELIGVAIGETKDVTAKFPENYGKAELNGKEAIFTCKINSIQRPQTEDEIYSELNFDTAEEYKNDIKKRAVKQHILNTVVANSKITSYPQEDLKVLGEVIFNYYVSAYGVTADYFNQMLASQGYSADTFKSEMATEMMSVNMLMYYIFDTEKLTITDKDIEAQGDEHPILAKSYAIQDAVMEYLYEKATIK